MMGGERRSPLCTVLKAPAGATGADLSTRNGMFGSR
jgi:hypothetical protein